MKGILIKFNLNSLIGKVKLVPGMIAGMSGKTKSTIIKVASGVGLAGVLIAGTVPSLNQNTDAVLPPTENTQDQDDELGNNQEEESDNLELSFLSDELNITDIDMESILGQRVANEVAAAAEGMAPVEGIGVDESGKPLTKEEINQVDEKIEGNYFIAPDGTPWVSEEEYNRYIAGQNGVGEEVVTTDTTTTTGESYFIAPDGSFWESEEAYNEYINGLNNTNNDTPAQDTPTTGTGNDNGNNNNQNNDSSYKAPDGSYWDSEQDYLDYIAQGQNSNNDYYVAPDGSYWESEEQYNSYISDLTSAQSTGDVDDNTNNNTGTNDTGYFAPDGSYWASEQDYIDYINSLNNNNNNNNNENNQNQENNENNNQNENSDDYFVAPDGSVWASEQDYNDYMNSLTNDSAKTM